jgi:Ser/Thr protein kinase RdoA (MazF antagonist)
MELVNRKPLPVTRSILSTKALASDILPDYDLGAIIYLKVLWLGLNDSYVLKMVDGEQLILRVYRTAWRSLSEISYEIDALNYLANKEIAISKPLSLKDGRFIHTLCAPEGTRYAVLFTYAAGKEPSYDEAGMEAFSYGKAVAKIHNASQGFASQHDRFRLDLDHLLDTPLKSIGPMLAPRETDWAYVQHIADKIRRRFDKLPGDTLEQGFCHGDFHGGNAHVADDGTITFFDFDCCGWGWRAYDIAVFRWRARLIEKENEYWEPFLRGYTEERTIRDIDIEAIPLFIGIRHLWLLGLQTGNGHDFGFGWMNDKYFDKALKFLREWDAEYFGDTYEPPSSALATRNSQAHWRI